MPLLTAPDPKQLREEEDARLLPLVSELADEIETLAQEIGPVETKLFRQHGWLVAHRDDPRWQDRKAVFERTQAEREELLSRFYKLAAHLERRITHLSAHGRRTADLARPGVSDGITWARRIHYQHSPAWGLWLTFTED